MTQINDSHVTDFSSSATIFRFKSPSPVCHVRNVSPNPRADRAVVSGEATRNWVALDFYRRPLWDESDEGGDCDMSDEDACHREVQLAEALETMCEGVRETGLLPRDVLEIVERGLHWMACALDETADFDQPNEAAYDDDAVIRAARIAVDSFDARALRVIADAEYGTGFFRQALWERIAAIAGKALQLRSGRC